MNSNFITEKEIAEARKRRQEEWEKVRTPDQPLERPEEPFDGRTLYDRLMEQKAMRDLEYEESHKLKNLIRGLNDDEVQFLELVDQNKIDAEKKQLLEEQQELNDFRNRVASLQEECADKKIQSEIAPHKIKTLSSRPSQKSLLSVGIKRKNGEINNSASSSNATNESVNKDSRTETLQKSEEDKKEPTPRKLSITTDRFDSGQFKCIAILPGIGPYTESSDSEISSGSEEDPEVMEKYDLVGRKREKKACTEQ